MRTTRMTRVVILAAAGLATMAVFAGGARAEVVVEGSTLSPP